MPTSITPLNVYQFGLDGSKSWYSGPKTIISVPASRSASPIISAVNLLPGKVTSVLLGKNLSSLGQFFVFRVVGMQTAGA